MTAFFLRLVNMSISAGWLILAVMVLRLVFKKAPKWISCVLWALVGIRLVCPVLFESSLSLIPSAETFRQDVVQYSPVPVIDSGISFLNNAVNPLLGASLKTTPGDSTSPLFVWVSVAAVIWAAGAAVMLGYGTMSYIRLYKRVAAAVPFRDRIWLCDEIRTPFILGIIKPRIYLPSGVEEGQWEYVTAHERAHLGRRDHWWKPLGFLLLAVYWFNPLVWAAYILLCRDIEMACDERVIRNFDLKKKKAYSDALLSCSISHRAVTACPLAFGEVGVKQRVSSVLNYKKPAFGIVIVAVVVCGAVAAGFLTNPKSKQEDGNENPYFYGMVLEVLQNSVLVAPEGGSPELKSASRIWVDLGGIPENGALSFKTGDLVRIEYDGKIAETFPAWIFNLFSMEKAEGEYAAVFEDRWYRQSRLSKETLEWLEGYNSLSKEEQLKVNSIPAELLEGNDPPKVKETEAGEN